MEDSKYNDWFTMTKDIYETLTPKERLMYDELANFSKRLNDRMEELTEVLKNILKEANG